MKKKYKKKNVRCIDCSHLEYHNYSHYAHSLMCYACYLVPSMGWVSKSMANGYHTCGVFERATDTYIAKRELKHI
jgi:ribosomal protein S27E